jgi:heme o synthase
MAVDMTRTAVVSGVVEGCANPLRSAVEGMHALLELTKVRLSALVLLTTAVGFLAAGAGDSSHLLWTLVGTALAAGGAQAINQALEWRRDALMERTAKRPVPLHKISPRGAFLLGAGLAGSGLATLLLGVNPLTAGLGLAVVLLYTAVYTPLKVRTPLCTLAGAVCGAIPPMMGWTGATGSVGFGAWVLGTLLFLWQIPHFLSLAWLYREDYARGGFRMLPAVDPRGTITAHLVTLYCLALLPVGLVAHLAGMAGWAFVAGSLVLGGGQLVLGLRLAGTRTDASARRLFLATLAYLPLLLVILMADRQIPAAPSAVLAAAGLGRQTAAVTEVYPELLPSHPWSAAPLPATLPSTLPSQP